MAISEFRPQIASSGGCTRRRRSLGSRSPDLEAIRRPTITASTLKAWLYRKISEIAAWNHAQAEDPDCRTPLFAESSEALDRLAAYILRLPDNDGRLNMLAAAYPPHRALDELSFDLEGRCTSFGPNGYSCNSPDLWLSEFIQVEVEQLRRLLQARG